MRISQCCTAGSRCAGGKRPPRMILTGRRRPPLPSPRMVDYA
jgi:hypothetical protein